MKMTKFMWICLLFGAIVLNGCSNYSTAKIDDGVAIFYPNDFEPEKMLPSFALANEPVSTGRIPSDWKVVPTFFVDSGRHCATIPYDDGTDLYGTGEAIGGLRRNGKTCTLWNTDNYIYAKDKGKRLYQSHPWILGVRKDGSAFGVLIDNTWKQEIKLANPIKITSYGPAARIIVIDKPSPQQVLTALAKLTGTMDLPPLWALGFQQSRFSYFPDTKVKEIADGFRERQIPCDVIWMDINYMQNYKIFTFDSLGFSNPASVNDYLHQHQFKSVWMVDPGVKKEPGYAVYDQGTAGNHWVKTAQGDDFVGSVWPGPCVFPDFTRPDTQQWWSSLYRDFMATGIDGVWNDMNEPSVFDGPDGTMPEDNRHRGGNLPADVHLRYHNVYGMLMVKASREGIMAVNPDKRPFVLSRSNFLGGQRYAATWTGDNAASWEHLKMATPMVLNLGLSGQPFSGPDIGGYKGNPTADLMANWMTVGAFYPFCRNHSDNESPAHEPWALGPEVERASRTALERRYRLMPYLYTLFQEASTTGLPVMRPLFFADVTDLSLRAEDEAFLLGADVLVVPKWAHDPKLPQGIWRRVSLVGEDAEPDRYQPDLKQRGGSIIPLCQKMQSTNGFKLDSVTLLVCLDPKLEAKGVLYHDAGDGFAYRHGEFGIERFTAQQTDRTVTVKCEKVDGKLDSTNRLYRIGLVTDSTIVYSDWGKGNLLQLSVK